MKNQNAHFDSSTDATLSISLRRGRADWVISVRHRNPGEKTRVGCKDYVSMDQEADAQATFDQRVKEAVAVGWVLAERKARATRFTTIPPAPGAKPMAAGAQVNAAPRMAAAARR